MIHTVLVAATLNVTCWIEKVVQVWVQVHWGGIGPDTWCCFLYPDNIWWPSDCRKKESRGRSYTEVLLTVFVQNGPVALHPDGALWPQVCFHSASIRPVLKQGEPQAGDVTFKGGDVHTAWAVSSNSVSGKHYQKISVTFHTLVSDFSFKCICDCYCLWLLWPRTVLLSCVQVQAKRT